MTDQPCTEIELRRTSCLENHSSLLFAFLFHLTLIPLIKKKKQHPKPSSVEDKAEVILKLGFNHLFSRSICKLQQRLQVPQTSVLEACGLCLEQAFPSHSSISFVG